MYGGGGVDTVHYGDRALPVRVSLDDQRNDGEDSARDGVAEEADDVRSDVENVTGGWGADVLTGSAAANGLNDGTGNDTMNGLGGDDSFIQQAGVPNGADTMIGGTGRDNVSYKSRKAGVRVSLDDVANDGADVQGDGVAEEGDNVNSDVEDVTAGLGADRLEGSSAANTLVGYKADDVIVGGAGDDSLDGQSGADSLSGGAGRDRVLYASRTLPATVDIDGAWDDGTTEDVSGTRRDNVMTDVESIVGGAGDDTLTGSAADNALDGGKGADTFAGLDGADTITAWDGVTDRNVLCGAGVDIVSADTADPVAASGAETCEQVTRH
jgi:Ca2+-binding RTX toxin-like protein